MTTMAAHFGESGRTDHRAPREAFLGRVLIVEDDLPLGENLCEIIGMCGYEAVALPSAEAALAEIGSRSVGFIVTDNRLPGMSGAALLLALRSTGRAIPSVITTAWIVEAEAEYVVELGLTELLPKPVDIARLLSLIRGGLKR